MANATTQVDPKTWSVGEITDLNKTGKISLPRFQRAQVWTETKKKELIKSVLSGFPIGSLLVYEKIPNEKYQIIDGLQRVTAFLDYEKDPLNYIDFENVVESSPDLHGAFDAICRVMQKRGPSLDNGDIELKEAIAKWLPEVSGFSPSKYYPNAMTDSVINYYLIDFPEETKEVDGHELRSELTKVIIDSEFLDHLKESVALSSYPVPVIIYRGDRKNLPDIFEKINTEGTKLSKYDVLASVWYDNGERVLIENTDIQSAIEEKYAQVIEDGFEVDEIDHDSDAYTLFEFLFGVGKCLTDEKNGFPDLFNGAKQGAHIESASFTLACIAYHLKLSDIANLPHTIREAEGIKQGATLNLSKFYNALIESTSFVSKTLNKYIGIQFQKPFIAHTEYQICSYILRALVGRYKVGSWEEREGHKEDRSLLKKYIPQHYLYGLISNNWGNAGDSTMFNNVWAGSEPSSVYLSGFSKKEWSNVLDVWFSEEQKMKQTKRSAVGAVDKVFLKYIYGSIATAAEEKEFFDIDHIYPVKLLAKEIDNTGSDGCPISAVGNLAFFESTLNKKKKDKTLKAFYDSLDDENCKKVVQRFALCDPQNEDITEGWTLENYREFLNMRNEILKERLLQVLNLSEETS